MRVSVPTIPSDILRGAAAYRRSLPTYVVNRVSRFLSAGNVAVLTGAGVSVDSGIRAYRGSKGSYLNPNYKPIFYHELMEPSARGKAFRQRYWLRSYLGYPPVRDAEPNPIHFILAALQYSGKTPYLITQNVDGLHHKAIREFWDDSRRAEHILELHGTLHSVKCSHGHQTDRQTFQDMLGAANPQWQAYAEELERSGSKPRTNPDGDVVLPEGTKYDEFVIPECPRCLLEDRRNTMQKPEVIFFGESISQEVKDKSFDIVDKSDKLFVIGTTLATFSAFRLVKHALEQGKEVLVLNVGPTRAHDLAKVTVLDIPAGDVLPAIAQRTLRSAATENAAIAKMLASGVVKAPPGDYDDPIPRPTGL
ncbi:DHS-like NAD/FAD-binding domain-containing protein [Trametes elegans]|nr:DHS-like NAD/FAD-binding domain-containing protein [Trametes elegans]